MSHITLYGIPNCDTVKKARAWLTANGLDCPFHDFKKQGVPADLAPGWARAVGWEKLLNRKGTAWRALDAATQASVVDAHSAPPPTIRRMRLPVMSPSLSPEVSLRTKIASPQ